MGYASSANPLKFSIINIRLRRNAAGFVVEVDQGDNPSQKATVGQNGSAINFNGVCHTPAKRPIFSIILIGLELISIALLMYFAFVRPAHGG